MLKTQTLSPHSKQQQKEGTRLTGRTRAETRRWEKTDPAQTWEAVWADACAGSPGRWGRDGTSLPPIPAPRPAQLGSWTAPHMGIRGVRLWLLLPSLHRQRPQPDVWDAPGPSAGCPLPWHSGSTALSKNQVKVTQSEDEAGREKMHGQHVCSLLRIHAGQAHSGSWVLPPEETRGPCL